MGLPHGSKSLSGAVKPLGDTQQPGSQNHQSTSPVDLASSHSSSVIVSCATSSNHSAVKTPCTSSFAAALKKLAKQAVDPVTTVSSVNSVSTPLPTHQSLTPEHHSLTSGQLSTSSIPPVPASITSVLNYVNHSTESRNKYEFDGANKSQKGSVFPKTIKSGLYNIKREEIYYENNDTGRCLPSSHQRPEVGRDSEESQSSSSGFQLYRNFDRAQNSISSYEHAMSYPYQPNLLPPPPSFSHQTYRLEDATFVDHYGILRNTTTYIPSSSANVHLPFLARSSYSPEILGQSIRVASPNDLFTIHERAKYAQNQGQEPFRHSSRERIGHVIQSPLPVTFSRNSESPGHPGSITHGTPREHSNKHSSSRVTVSSTPLSLVRCNHQSTNKWDSHHQIVLQCSQAKSSQEELGFNHSTYLQQELQQPLAMTGRRPVISELQSVSRDKNYTKKHSISQRRQVPNPPNMDVSYSQSPPLSSPNYPTHLERLGLKPPTYSSKPEPQNRLTLLNQERKSVISADSSPHSQAELCKTEAVSPKDLTPYKSNFSCTINEQKTLGEAITKLTVNKAQATFENHLGTSVLKTEATSRDVTQQVTPNVHVRKVGCNTQVKVTGCTSQQCGLVSKLDLEWEKLQKARLAGKCGNSDDEVESENGENCLKEILIITKGPPLSLDLSPKKLEFLDTVGLTTHQKKQELEFAKYVQGRKVLQERPIFPLDSNNTSREYSPLPLTTNITPEELCFAADFPHKVKFLQFLALKLTTFQERIEIERKWKITEEGRIRRKQKLRSKHKKKAKVHDRKPEITSLERLPMKSKKRRLQPSPNHSNEASAQKDYNPPNKITPSTKLQVSLSNRQTSAQDVDSTVSAVSLYSNLSQDSDSKSQKVVSVLKTPDKKPQKLANNFVQEFHKSVLETTQQQLAGQNCLWSAKKRTGTNSPPTLDFPEINYREKTEKYHWPGIEVVMEAYENYSREQKQEQEFLVERCHYLQRKNYDANNGAEKLHYQMTELLQLKYRLDEERHSYQAAIDYLKRTLQLIR
ncbi:uncharacterized protein LOC143257830 [Tachypleus tridentatus]|uniref:uncharacterized protein LOC143257830 n=1 Tax=Tachypleus tridentatus TaxID=6853 RepID=UPI003FD60AE5